MLKIDRKISVYISIVLTAVMFVGAVVLAFFVPTLLEYALGTPGLSGSVPALSQFQRTLCYAAAYTEIALMLLGLGLLFALLLKVKEEKVFTVTAVGLIRYISWCLIFMGIIMMSLTFCSMTALFVGAAILFVGLTTRVVKNVIEAAVWLKEENDLTV